MTNVTIRKKILLAAVDVRGEDGEISAASLARRAFERWPDDFGLGGSPPCVDTMKVLPRLSGVDGLCGLGWLARTGAGRYRMTRQGERVAASLGAPAEALARARVAPTPKPRRAAPAPPPEAAPEAHEAPQASEPDRVPDVPSPTATPPRVAPVFELPPDEVRAVTALARGAALQKFLRGSPVTLADACAFWGLSPTRAQGSAERAAATGRLLERAVESFGAEGDVATPLPPLSTCFGLLNLHRLMVRRFARELGALPADVTGGGA